MDIELRSEKTRKLIGQVPPRLIRGGTAIIAIILLALFAAAYYLPYPQKIYAEMTVIQSDSSTEFVALFPFEFVAEISVGMSATIEFEGYSAAKFGFAEAVVSNIDKNIVHQEGQSFFKVKLKIVSKPFADELQIEQKGSVEILVSQKSLLESVL